MPSEGQRGDTHTGSWGGGDGAGQAVSRDQPSITIEYEKVGSVVALEGEKCEKNGGLVGR